MRHKTYRFLLTLLILYVLPTAIHATIFTVTSPADAGAGTLRQAVLDANNDANAPHYIYFSTALSQGSTSITVTSYITLTREIHIDGYHNASSNLTARAIYNRTAIPVRVSCSANYFIILGTGGSNSSISGLDIKMTYSGNSSGFLKQSNAIANNIHIWGCSFNYDFNTDKRYTDAATNSRFAWIEGSVGSTRASNSYGWFIGSKNIGNEDQEGNLIADGYSSILTRNIDNMTISGNYFGVQKNGLYPTSSSISTTRAIYIENGSGFTIGIFDKSSSKVDHQKNLFGCCNVPIDIYQNYTDGGLNTSSQFYRKGNNKIAGNYFGVDRNGNSGTNFFNNQAIYLEGSCYNIIGGSTPIEGNIISGVKTEAIAIVQSAPSEAQFQQYSRNFYPSSNNTIAYNIIKNNGGTGILLDGSDSYLPTTNKSYDVCSYNIVSNNEITNNQIGVRVKQGTANGGYVRYNTIQGNTINGNKGLGIELVGAGISTQALGIDGNNGTYSSALEAVQEEVDKPVIISATHTSGSTTATISGHVGNDLNANTNFTNITVDLYKADISSSDNGPVNFGDANTNIGHGEALVYLGSTTTDANGLFSLDLTNSEITDGISITAIATSPNGSTSEFGPNVPLTTKIIRVLDVDPNNGRGSRTDTYNLGGSDMLEGKNKLNCTTLFGPSGIVSHPINIETAAGEVGSINASFLKNYDIVFIGSESNQTYTSVEISALKEWSADPHHVIIVCDQAGYAGFSSQMGLTLVAGNSNPSNADPDGVDSKTVKLFSGIFGTTTSDGIREDGAAQGYYENKCGTWSLAKNADNNSTVIIDNYNDVYFADGNFFMDNDMSGCGINNNADKVWCNLWAWAVDQVINGSESPSYMKDSANLTLLTTPPSSSTNTGKIQSTVPIGYTFLGWQTSTDGGNNWEAISSKDNPYSFTNAIDGQMYRSKLRGGSGCATTYSSALTISYALVTPVKLSGFHAEFSNPIVNLSWTTVTEVHNKGFNVQRSVDGKTFTNIGFVSSLALNGNSNSPLNYINSDKTPEYNSKNYYRLEQIDQDGKSTLSDIVTLSIGSSDNKTLKIYPNPVLSTATITGIEVGNNFGIYNSDGRLVYRFVASNSTQLINLANLPTGIYFIKLINSSNSSTIRFLKK